ncbi:MAG: FAD-dependent oxidoreductase [Candidatus Eremiobacteraeota bacterium]|nr:FAD-dependent oxidoreductase [Candidatus Eremiobacteraeota bacterium]
MATMNVRCCIAGGGPAGMMLGFLLARAGVEIVVLEKHADFLRDFRGDTVHPSTLEVMGELGLLDDFLKLPHTEVSTIGGMVNDVPVEIADLRRLRTRCKFIALMPQWDFLNFLAERGARYATFRVLMRAEVTELILEGGRVAGVRAATPDGPLEVRADLVVGADGRHSTVRARAGFAVQDLGAPIDVLWMRLPKHADDPISRFGYFEAGRLLVTLDRGDYWQCAYVIAKGGFAALQARGLQTLRDQIVALAPFLRERVEQLRDWDDVKLLTVVVDRLSRWYRPGLLCIGDAAHAMSPMGGVGINLAIQDAVATANILAQPLSTGSVTERDLRAVQRRRTFPMRAIQAMQVFVAGRAFRNIGAAQPGPSRPGLVPWPVRLLQRFPFLRRLPAWFIGVGPRPEHVRTPERATPRSG